MVFLREDGHWAQLIFSDSRFPPYELLLIVMERAEGGPGNLFRLPFQTTLCTVCGEEWWYPFKAQYPSSKYGDMLFSLGARPNCTQMHDLPQVHSGENAHDLEFGITVSHLTPFFEKSLVFFLGRKTIHC